MQKIVIFASLFFWETMDLQHTALLEGKVTVSASTFKGDNTESFYILSHKETGPAAEQYNDILEAVKQLPIKGSNIVFKRLYASDVHTTWYNAAKLADVLPNDHSALALIQQRPLSAQRYILFLYVVDGKSVSIEQNGKFTHCKREAYTDVWCGNYEASLHPNSFEQTKHIFRGLSSELQKWGMTIPRNLVRTWLFVNNVDKNYSGVVNARKEFFTACGLNKNTHYIASTGIEGTSADLNAYVSMDALCIDGITHKQVQYISALDHLNPTHEYGVTFERASVVEYGDRRHFYLSGTASINNKGQVVHQGNVLKQAQRALENINALLASANFTMKNMAYFIVYLRDIADYPLVQPYLDKQFGSIPYMIVEGPVCRPDWLIEIEGEGIQVFDSNYANF